MQITFASILWSLLAIASLLGLYYFNQRGSLFHFITDRKFLVFLIAACLLGMRGLDLEGGILVFGVLVWMTKDYKPYLERCRRFKRRQQSQPEPKHH